MLVHAVAGIDDMRTYGLRESSSGAPGELWRTTMASIPIASMFLAVSIKVSPLLILDPLGLKSMVSAPRRRAARLKLVRVRVEASKRD